MQNLVLRREWSARPPRSTLRLTPARIRYLVVHYSAFNGDEQSDHANCAGRVRAIQDFHMDSRGWADIAYNWLFCKHGYIFRGRGWPIMSAATSGANQFTVAACFLGDDTLGRDDVTLAGRQALSEIWRFVILNGPSVQGGRGHRDFSATRCPGDELYRIARGLHVV
jgi:hypothetical protein